VYFDVSPLVNYMWKLDLSFSYQYAYINYTLLFVLLVLVPSKSILEKHFFLIIINGIFMPITIIANHIHAGMDACLLFFASIMCSIVLYRFLDQFLKIKNTINITGSKFLTVNRYLNSIFIVSSFMIGYLLITNRSGLKSLNIFQTLDNVYDIRAETSLEGLAAYFPGWIVGFLVPVLVASFLLRKDWISLMLSFVGVFLMFQVFAMKMQLFSLILLVAFGLVFKFSKYVKNYIVEIFYFIVFVICMFEGKLLYAFLDRFFYLPGQLNIHYYQFFSANRKNYFHGSKLGVFFNEPGYTKPMGYVIDEKFYGGGMNANTGYLASTYADIGIFGLVFASVLVAVLLYFLKMLFRKSNEIGYLIAIQVAFILVNAPLTDIFLTNGIIFVFFFALLIKKNVPRTQRIDLSGNHSVIQPPINLHY
jgi:hypothetical protein